MECDNNSNNNNNDSVPQSADNAAGRADDHDDDDAAAVDNATEGAHDIRRRHEALDQHRDNALLHPSPLQCILDLGLNNLFRLGERMHQTLERVEAQTTDPLDQLRLQIQVAPEIHKNSREIRSTTELLQRLEREREKNERD